MSNQRGEQNLKEVEIFRKSSNSESNSNDTLIPPIMKILMNNNSLSEDTLTTIKKEVAEILPATGQAPGDSHLRELSKKLEGVDKLLTEPKIQSMISSIAGKDINNLIEHTLGASSSNRQEALTIGLQSIQSILAKTSAKSSIDKDLAMSFASLVRK